MRIRQVAIAAPALEPVVEDLRAVLGLEVCFHDPGVDVFGLRNALLPVGDAFLEVLAPIRPSTAVGRFLERRAGPGVYMVIVQTDDLAAERALLAARWSQVLGRPILRSRDGSPGIPLDGSAIGFRVAPRGQGDGVS